MTVTAPPRLGDYLQHIVQAIERIERYTAGLDEAGFVADTKTQDAVVRNIQRHHPSFAATEAQVPWAVMVGMRNRVSHGYFALDWALIWATVQHDLPPLRAQVRSLLDALAGPGA